MQIQRNPTRPVQIGTVTIGDGHSIAVQSMTAVRTTDIDATVAQINALDQAGADVVRIAVDSQADAEAMTRRLATEEGIFAGISSGGALAVALRLSQQLENAVIVSIICDRGDRYLSTGVFPA